MNSLTREIIFEVLNSSFKKRVIIMILFSILSFILGVAITAYQLSPQSIGCTTDPGYSSTIEKTRH